MMKRLSASSLGHIGTLILAVTVLGITIGCGKVEFNEFDFDRGGFSVALPTRQPTGETIKTKTGPVRIVVANAKGLRYLVTYLELPADLSDVTEDELFQAMDETLETKGQILSQKEVTIAGRQGKQIERKTAKGTHVLMRFVKAGNWFYVLTVSGTKVDPGAQETKTFFDSFKLKG
jgi:hypothetical protein